MKQAFSILHISDLHERGPREGEPARRERVLGDAWLRNLDEIRKEGVDLVCMTGDLGQSGKPDEYDRAGEFLARTLAELGLGRDRLFLIPGNHDIDRSRSRKAWQALRGNIHRADQLEVARWIAGGRTPLGMETAWLKCAFRRNGLRVPVELDRAFRSKWTGDSGAIGPGSSMSERSDGVRSVLG